MSPETPHESPIECAGGCPPSHRRLRRALTFIVVLLLMAIGASLVYLARTGGFSS